MAQARSKVARETRSLRPVLMPLSLRCTKPGAGIDAGDHHDMVVVATVTSCVPDRLGVDGRDHLVLSGQILLEAPDGRLPQRGLHAVMRQQDRQVCDVGTYAAR